MNQTLSNDNHFESLLQVSINHIDSSALDEAANILTSPEFEKRCLSNINLETYALSIDTGKYGMIAGTLLLHLVVKIGQYGKKEVPRYIVSACAHLLDSIPTIQASRIHKMMAKLCEQLIGYDLDSMLFVRAIQICRKAPDHLTRLHSHCLAHCVARNTYSIGLDVISGIGRILVPTLDVRYLEEVSYQAYFYWSAIIHIKFNRLNEAYLDTRMFFLVSAKEMDKKSVIVYAMMRILSHILDPDQKNAVSTIPPVLSHDFDLSEEYEKYSEAIACYIQLDYKSLRQVVDSNTVSFSGDHTLELMQALIVRLEEKLLSRIAFPFNSIHFDRVVAQMQRYYNFEASYIREIITRMLNNNILNGEVRDEMLFLLPPDESKDNATLESYARRIEEINTVAKEEGVKLDRKDW